MQCGKQNVCQSKQKGPPPGGPCTFYLARMSRVWGGLRAGTVHCLLNFIGKPTEVFVQPVEDFALRQVRIG